MRRSVFLILVGAGLLVSGCFGGRGGSSGIINTGPLKNEVLYYSGTDAGGEVIRQALDGSSRTTLFAPKFPATSNSYGGGLGKRIGLTRDGTTIAALALGAGGAVVTNLYDQNGVTQLSVSVGSPATALYPEDLAISPNGKMLVFREPIYFFSPIQSSRLYVYDVVAKTTTQIFGDLQVDTPTFSPDGTVIYVSVYNSTSKLWELRSTDITGVKNDLVFDSTADVRHVCISDDGKKAVYASGADGTRVIQVVTLSTKVVQSFPTMPGDNINPSWSSDGSRIAFSSNREGKYKIYFMNADGSGLTRLTNNSVDNLYPNIR